MRYLGLDVGQKFLGIAVGELLAKELTTISAAKDRDFYSQPEAAYTQLAKIIEDEGADAIVAGLPVDEDGAPTEESKKIEKFCRGLEDKLNVTVHFVDETLTSFMAEDMLESQGLSADEIKKRTHQLSAELILQQFLEEHAAGS
ncbi:MAG TPA: Holliday junction resolvase RuvX [Candidatus Saccharimonadales bacterium]|nr:Holliday junction resolvase RuvX [Candidatus Saccharimonadales bacterium]